MVEQVAGKIFKWHSAMPSEYAFDRYDATRTEEISSFLLSRKEGWYDKDRTTWDDLAGEMGLTEDEREFALDNSDAVEAAWLDLTIADNI